MKNFTTIHLRLWIPLLVFGAFSLLLLFFTLQEHHQEKLDDEERALTALRELLASTGPRFEGFLRNGMNSFVEAEIGNLSITTEVRSVVFVDDQGIVLYGSQMGWLGHPVQEIQPLFDRNHFLSAQKSRRPDIQLSADRQDIIAYQPVVFTVEPGQIRPTRVGMIFVDYDLSRSKIRIFHILVVRIISVWAVGLLLMLTLWAALNRWLTRPLTHLKERVNRFSHGDYLVRAEVTGHGELTELSQAFNIMADEVLRTSAERRKSEESIREKENRYRTLLEQATDAIFVSDINAHFIDVSRKACESLGYTREELLTLSLSDVDLNFETEQHAKKLWAELSAGKTLTIESSHRRKDGSFFPVEIHIGKLEISGQPAILGIARDISERKQVEEKIKAHQDFLQNALDALTHPFYVINANDYTIKLSNKASHFGEYGEGTTCFQLTHDRSEPCTGEDHPCSLLEVKRTKQPVVVEHIHTDSAGKKKSVEIHAYPIFDSNGNLSQVIEYCLDISERKQGEEERRRLVTAIEQGVDSVVITDRDGMIQYVNPSFEKITGYSKGEVIGRNPRILQSGKHDALFYQEMWKTLTSGKAWRGHLINKKKDGTLFEEEVSITPVLNQAGEIINQVAVKRDVTEQMKLEEQLRQAQKMEAIGTMAGGIAHDFNNILSAILGYSELAKRRLPPGTAAIEDIDQVINSGKRATALVQQILDFSRKTEQKLQPLQPHLIVQEVLQLLHSTLPTTVEIEEDIDPACGTIMADSTKLHQVIMNLCTNAFQALKDEKGTLRVTLSRQERFANAGEKDNGSPVPFIVLSVSDTGQGMAPEAAAHIFEPYFTTKEQGSRKGTGLGLSIAHGIIEEYKGFIEVESEPGHGSTFRVFIPALEKNNVTPEKLEKEKSSPLGTERILVVDDEPLLVRLSQRILEDYGYTVTGVTDSRSALEMVRAEPLQFDLLISDQTMPGLSGSELAKAVLDIAPDMPIIICTGHSAVTSAKDAYAMGIKRYLHKPVQGDELVRTVRMVLDEQEKF